SCGRGALPSLFRSAPAPARTTPRARAAWTARGSIPRPSFQNSNRRGQYTSACPSFEFRRLSSVDAQQESDEIADDLIGGEEEDRSQRNHHEDHDRGDRRHFLAGHPLMTSAGTQTMDKRWYIVHAYSN